MLEPFSLVLSSRVCKSRSRFALSGGPGCFLLLVLCAFNPLLYNGLRLLLGRGFVGGMASVLRYRDSDKRDAERWEVDGCGGCVTGDGCLMLLISGA